MASTVLVVASSVKRLDVNVDVLKSEITLVMVVVIISSELVEISDRNVVVVANKTIDVVHSGCVLVSLINRVSTDVANEMSVDVCVFI